MPEAQFSYGSDGNLTSDLAQTEPVSPNYGDLYFDTADDNKRVLSYYVGYSGDRDGAGGIWRNYHLAFGTPEMGETPVDRILWTKDTFQANRLTLPNDRNVTRRYVEYVVQGNEYTLRHRWTLGHLKGFWLYGCSQFDGGASLSEDFDDHASGYVPFSKQGRIRRHRKSGTRIELNCCGVCQLVRISGKGFRPSKFTGSAQQIQPASNHGKTLWAPVLSNGTVMVIR